MQRCWDKDPDVRPPFSDIVVELERIVEDCEVLEANVKVDRATKDRIGRDMWKSQFLRRVCDDVLR